MTEDLALLHQKIDYLTEQLDAQRRRQEVIDELIQDFIPIGNHLVRLTIDELDEIGNDFEMEDLLFLLKRILRNTHTWLGLLDRLEAAMDLVKEVELLGGQVFDNTIEQLNTLEQQGFFDFAREGWRMAERIVTEFSEEDARALADNVVTILKTIRSMTQPEILTLANNAVEAINQPPEDMSTLALLREFSDPKVRKGMARMLNLVKTLAD